MNKTLKIYSLFFSKRYYKVGVFELAKKQEKTETDRSEFPKFPQLFSLSSTADEVLAEVLVPPFQKGGRSYLSKKTNSLTTNRNSFILDGSCHPHQGKGKVLQLPRSAQPIF